MRGVHGAASLLEKLVAYWVSRADHVHDHEQLAAGSGRLLDCQSQLCPVTETGCGAAR